MTMAIRHTRGRWRVRRLLTGVALGLALAIAASAAAAESVYIQSQRADLLDGPGLDHDTVAELERGAQVEVLERGSGWVRVRHSGGAGWVSGLLVDDKPPMERKSRLEGEREMNTEEVRTRPSQVASAAAARGLAEEVRARAREDQGARYDLLEQVESAGVDPATVRAFYDDLRGGRDRP